MIFFARQWVPCHADAEDVFHTAFLRFWQNRKGVRDPLAFLYTCVRRTALNWIRERNRRQNHEQQTQPQPLFATSTSQLAEIETNTKIQQALSQLPVEQREVVVMRVWGELSFPQIAEVLSTSASTADTRYRAGLKQLRHQLNEIIDA